MFPLACGQVWEFMTGINEPRLQIVEKESPPNGPGDVITFSHFLPRKELPLPGVHEMSKASGCLKIEEQLRRVKAKMHGASEALSRACAWRRVRLCKTVRAAL